MVLNSDIRWVLQYQRIHPVVENKEDQLDNLFDAIDRLFGVTEDEVVLGQPIVGCIVGGDVPFRITNTLFLNFGKVQ